MIQIYLYLDTHIYSVARNLLLSFALLASSAANAALPLEVDGAPLPSLAPMLEKIQAAVVNISTTTKLTPEQNPLMRDPFFRDFFQFPERRSNSSLGSGVVINAKKGYIMTNHHVIDEADEITVTTKDGHTLDAKLVGTDAASDVAVIAVESDNLSEIPLGKSADLRVGDFVVAIGNPFGLSQTVTSGIVSALGRSDLGIEGYEDFIQTDASINPGNSGGALVDLRGRLVGINTAIFSRGGGSVGIGFAIPIDMAKTLMDQLVEHGNIQRGLLGVTMQDLTPTLADAFGISGKKGTVVSRVLPDSAAFESGIKEGDVVVKLNDTPVDDSADLRNAVGLLRPGAKVRVSLYRDGKLKLVTARIKERDDRALHDPKLSGRLEGARFRMLAPSTEHNGRVEVAELALGSRAQRSGLAEKDIILSLNRQPIKSLKQLEKAVKRANGPLLIKLLRRSRVLFLVIQ